MLGWVGDSTEDLLVGGSEETDRLLQLENLYYQLGFKSGVWIGYLVGRLFLY